MMFVTKVSLIISSNYLFSTYWAISIINSVYGFAQMSTEPIGRSFSITKGSRRYLRENRCAGLIFIFVIIFGAIVPSLFALVLSFGVN